MHFNIVCGCTFWYNDINIADGSLTHFFLAAFRVRKTEVKSVNRKIKSLLSTNIQLYVIILVLFAIATFFFGKYSTILAGAEIATILILLVYTRVSGRRRSREMLQYIESVTANIDNATKNTLQSFPLPMVTFTLEENEIIYANESFSAITGGNDRLLAVNISSIVPGFTARWLMEGKVEYPELVTVGDRRYRVFGNLVRGSDAPGVKNFVATTYWVDETEYAQIREEFLPASIFHNYAG